MCNKPWLLVVAGQFGEDVVSFYEGEGPAEEAGKQALEDNPILVSFSVYRIVSEFARVTEIKRISLTPSMMGGE